MANAGLISASLGISANQLARQVKVPQNRISQIIAGKRAITGDTTLRLGLWLWFRNSAEFWLNLQSAYELRLAEQRKEDVYGVRGAAT